VKWTVVDGAMVPEPAKQPITPTGDSKQTWPQGFLGSVDSFRDFEMTAEVLQRGRQQQRPLHPLREAGESEQPRQLLRDQHQRSARHHADRRLSSACIRPLPYRVKSAGKWSRFDVLAEGTHLVVKVNGETLTDVNDGQVREGALGLQAGGPTGSGLIKFRNIRIHQLPSK
jgi:hypothetical protein